MSSLMPSQPISPSTSATASSVGRIASTARSGPRKAIVSISRMPATDQKKVPHWVAMIASVVRVIRNDRPVR